MGKIFCVIGKSSTGKDTIYKALLNNLELGLDNIVTYTTRPIRQGEKNGVEYFFTDEEGYQSLLCDRKIVEERVYNTIHGPWRYFTVANNISEEKNYLMIGTLEAYLGLVKYYGENKIYPIYIYVDDGIRLQRAIDREKKQETPKYEELCRRFLADSEDFSEEKLNEAGIEKRFENNNLNDCIEEIANYISNNL